MNTLNDALKNTGLDLDAATSAHALVILAVRALDLATTRMTEPENIRLARIARLALIDIKHTIDDIGV